MRRTLTALGLAATLIGCGTTTQNAVGPHAVAIGVEGSVVTPVLADGPSNPNGPLDRRGGRERTRCCAGSTQESFVAVWVDVPKRPSKKVAQAPASVALVIDTSGSMSGREDQARAGVGGGEAGREALRDGDMVSVHSVLATPSEERVAPVKLDALLARSLIASAILEISRLTAARTCSRACAWRGIVGDGRAVEPRDGASCSSRTGNATVGTTSREMHGAASARRREIARRADHLGRRRPRLRREGAEPRSR
jgi:hypothetical protein